MSIDVSTIQPGQEITVTGSDGAPVAAFTATGSASTQLVTASGIAAGGSYELQVDGTAIGTAVATEATQAAAGGPGGGRGRG